MKELEGLLGKGVFKRIPTTVGEKMLSESKAQLMGLRWVFDFKDEGGSREGW